MKRLIRVGVISTNQTTKDGLKKATVEMKSKERQKLVGRRNKYL